jgi:hypothetical protein
MGIVESTPYYSTPSGILGRREQIGIFRSHPSSLHVVLGIGYYKSLKERIYDLEKADGKNSEPVSPRS